MTTLLLLDNISESVKLQLTNRLAARIVREELATPKDATAIAVVFTSIMKYLETDQEEFIHRLEGELYGVYTIIDDTTYALGIRLDGVISILRAVRYIHKTEVCIGKHLYEDLVTQARSSKMRLASDNEFGIEDRKRNFTSNRLQSPDAEKAIKILESTKIKVSSSMLSLAREVYKHASPAKRLYMDNEMYVLKGAAEMIPEEAYVSEFFFDKRFRMYQADCYGPNGQSSDLARSLVDLHGVGDYNVRDALKHIMDEIEDMTSFRGNDLVRAINRASSDSIGFILDYIDGMGNVKKPWNFVKFALLITEIKNGGKPYIGVAVGLDAKCSGPQLGGLLVADDTILTACGFTTKQVDDAYRIAIKKCVLQGLNGITREMIKKSFMAVFYGASVTALMDKDTIEYKLYNHLYTNKTVEEIETIAKSLHMAITLSFGERLNYVRRLFKEAGMMFVPDIDGVRQPAVCKYFKPVEYSMPDGSVVKVDYRVKINAYGEEVFPGIENPDLVVVAGGVNHLFKKPTYNTNEYDLPSYSRKGFVNFIQAIDAQLARLVVRHCKRLGARHIVSIHDCFRVNINDVEILEQAIKEAYLELFGCINSSASTYLPMGTDMLKMYFEGSLESTKDEYKNEAPMMSQFYSHGRRVLNNIDGVKFTTLVHQLGKTKYFAK